MGAMAFDPSLCDPKNSWILYSTNNSEDTKIMEKFTFGHFI